jgi:hypothetical protein
MAHQRHLAIAHPGVRRRGGCLARRDGKTVAELIATMSVILTFVGTTMITTGRVGPVYLLRGATRQVAANLYRTRMSAVTENNRYLVQFTNNHTDTILDDDNNDGTAETGEPVQTVNIQLEWSGVTMSSTGSITFLPDGTVVAPATITLQKSGTAGKTITVTQAGSIQVQ